MVKKKMRRYTYALATLGALLQTTGAFAKIPSVAFKGFSKHYKKKAYDLVIGAASDTSGFIYDMRFFGNFKPAYDVNKKRDYINDSSDDPLWNAAKILLPSPSGQLTTEQAIAINFGKNATPKTVALLQSFIHSLREGEVVDENRLMQDMIASFKPFKSTAEVPAGAVQAIRALKNLKDTTLSPIIKKQVSPQAWNPLNKDITNIIKKTSSDDEKKTEVIQKIQEYLRKKEEDDVKARKQAIEKEMLEKTLKPLLSNLRQSLVNENDSLYMPGMTEQVLSSFFCAHFNTQADIREYMENLDDRIVDKANLPKTDDYLKQEDLPGIAAKLDPFDLDEFYDLAEASIFTALTPYKEGTSLVSNGNTYRYDRTQDKLRTADPVFADCAEKGALHIMNLLHYDHITREYDLKPIQAFVAQKEQENGIINPYFKNYTEFYEKHPPASANAGDIESRSQWNRVVGDLNAFDDSLHISYIKGSNELNAGFLNFVRVFQKIFGLTLDVLPTTGLQAQKDWLKKSLNTLFTTVNPAKTYQFNLSGVTEKDNDLSGSIGVVVGNKAQEALFSFEFQSVTNVHSAIKQLKTVAKVEEWVLKTHSTLIHQGTTEEALWMVAPADVRDSKLTHPLYKLFNIQLADNDSKISYLKTVKNEFGGWKDTFLSTPEKLQTFKNILGNVLDEISWDDQRVVARISPVILGLTKEKELQDTLSEKVGKKLSLHASGIENIKGVENLTYLEEIDLGSSKNLQSLSLSNHTNLKEVKFQKSQIQTIKLENLPNLEKLEDFAYRNEVQDVDLKSLGKLKELNFNDSIIKQIKLENLPELELMDAESTKELESVFAKNLIKLKKIALMESNVKKIELENLDNLESLLLRETVNLDDILLKNLKSLKTISLRGSNVQKIEGYATLSNLKSFNLTNASNIKELEFREDRKDLKITLTGSGITNKAQIKGIEHLDENKITW